MALILLKEDSLDVSCFSNVVSDIAVVSYLLSISLIFVKGNCKTTLFSMASIHKDIKMLWAPGNIVLT